ncbi:MFS transporter [Fredinandcohnia humi]
MNWSFFSLIVSQTSTNLSFALYTMAIIMYFYNETGLATISTTITLISVISRMISSFVLPIISDKFHSLTLIRFSQLIQLVFLSTLLFLLYLNPFSIKIMILTLVLMSIISFFNGWFSPIKSSLVGLLVLKDNRVKANSLLTTVDQMFMFAGWTLGGLLLTILGKEFILFISIMLLILSLASLGLIRLNNKGHIPTPEGILKRITLGWKTLFLNKELKVLITMDAIEGLVGTIWIGAITLTFVKEALNEGEQWWGYINGVYFLGMILGGLLIYRISHLLKKDIKYYMIIGSCLFGVLTTIYGFLENPILVLFLVLFMGPVNQVRDTLQETIFQNSTDAQTLTKVLAAKTAIIQLIFIISLIIISILTDLIGVRLVYVLSGVLLISSSIYGLFHFTSLKRKLIIKSLN